MTLLDAIAVGFAAGAGFAAVYGPSIWTANYLLQRSAERKAAKVARDIQDKIDAAMGQGNFVVTLPDEPKVPKGLN